MCQRIYHAYLQVKLAINQNFEYKDEHSCLSVSSGDHPFAYYKYVSGSPPSNKNIESTVKKAPQPSHSKKSYVQAFKSNILHVEEILQTKEAFPTLSANKVGKVLKIKNSSEDSNKPRINIMTRELSRKKVIIQWLNITLS